MKGVCIDIMECVLFIKINEIILFVGGCMKLDYYVKLNKLVLNWSIFFYVEFRFVFFFINKGGYKSIVGYNWREELVGSWGG